LLDLGVTRSSFAYGEVKVGDVPSRVRALSRDLGEPL